jgi:hypothetical protein
MLKEFLTKESLDVLNSFGLGLLIIGLIIVYRSLTIRAKSLSENLSDIKAAYDSVVNVMAKRAKELDMRFEDEKRFRSFYLSIVDDTEAHQAKVKKWKEEEIAIEHNRVKLFEEQLSKTTQHCEELIQENYNLKSALLDLQDKYAVLLSKNRELEYESVPARPAVRGLV